MVIDTSVFIDHLRAKDKTSTILYQLSKEESELYISAISIYELYMGATTDEKRQDVKNITEDLIILPFTDEAAQKASEIYHKLRSSNKMIEFRDIFIAATCLVFDFPILSFNQKHFRRIEGLQLIR